MSSDSEDGEEDPVSFAWTVGINLFVFFVCFNLYRKFREGSESSRRIYSPRLLLEDEKEAKGQQSQNEPSLRKLGVDTSSAWTLIRDLMRLTEAEMYPHIGLDGVLFLRVIDLGQQVGLFLTVCVALPLALVYAFAQDSEWGEDSDFTWAGYFGLSNVSESSSLLGAPVVFSYFATIVIIIIIETHQKKVIRWRRRVMQDLDSPTPELYAVLLRDIPCPSQVPPPFVLPTWEDMRQVIVSCAVGMYKGTLAVFTASSVSADSQCYRHHVEKYFSQLYPDTPFQVVMLPMATDVSSAVKKRDRAAVKLELFDSNAENASPQRDSNPKEGRELDEAAVLMQGEASARGALESSLKELSERVDVLRQEGRERPSCVAVIVFQSAKTAAAAATVMHSIRPNCWETLPAPLPQDISWKVLHTRWYERWIRGTMATLAVVAVWLMFLIPVTFVSGLSTADNLKNAAPWLGPLVDVPLWRSFLEGYLPGVALTLALIGVPYIFQYLAIYACFPTTRLQKFEAISNTYRLMVIDVLLGASFANAILDNLDDFIDNFSATDFLTEMGESIPNASFFFIVLICAKMGTSMSLEILRVTYLIKSSWYHLWTRSPSETCKYWQPKDPPYMTVIPWVLFIFLLQVVYSVVAPLLAPFALLYFSIAKISWRNQLLYIYKDTCDTKGQLWPYYMQSLVFGLVCSQVFLAGCLLTKGDHALMICELALALVTYIYYRFQDRLNMSFTTVSMDVAAKIDAQYPSTEAETAARAEAFIPPELQDEKKMPEKKQNKPEPVVSGYGSLEETPMDVEIPLQTSRWSRRFWYFGR